jgi:DNA-directed RNA polymerase subunit RPC12/RpoP
MNYRCPQCSRTLDVRKLYFRDISACAHCGQKVVLGDFLAFFIAAITMLVSALTALYVLSQEHAYVTAAGFALTIGMVAGIAVLLLLGKAIPFRRVRRRAAAGEPQNVPKAGA